MKKLNKKVNEVKVMLNMDLNKILVKTAQGRELTETEQFVLQAHYGLVEDKDTSFQQNPQEETIEEFFEKMEAEFAHSIKDYNRVNRKIKVCNTKHTLKGHLRDKAKAGKWSRKRSVYTQARKKWGLSEMWLTEAQYENKEANRQLQEMKQDKFTFNTDEVKKELMMVFNMTICGMNMMFYHHPEDFALITPWKNKCRSWMEMELKKMPSEGDVYSYLEDTYPEMGMADMKLIVEDFIGTWRLDILKEAGSMWRYVKDRNRAYQDEVMFDLHLAYGKMENLLVEIKAAHSSDLNLTGKFSVILAQIESLKMKLEKMNEANAKFI